MEEQVLIILQQSLSQPFNEEVCEEIAAKEIASHVMEFIKWVGENCFKYDNDDNGWLIITDESHDIELGNTEQCYQYWLNNIKLNK